MLQNKAEHQERLKSNTFKKVWMEGNEALVSNMEDPGGQHKSTHGQRTWGSEGPNTILAPSHNWEGTCQSWLPHHHPWKLIRWKPRRRNSLQLLLNGGIPSTELNLALSVTIFCMLKMHLFRVRHPRYGRGFCPLLLFLNGFN